MPMSLRNRAQNHIASKAAKEEKASAKRTPSISSDDTSLNSLHPDLPILPKQPEAARITPKKSLLERYRGRSPAAQMPPLITTNHTPKKKSIFTERFSVDGLGLSPTDAPILRRTSKQQRVEAKPDADHPTTPATNTDGQPQSPNTPAAPPNLLWKADNEFPLRRSTRIKTRRQERSASQASASEAEEAEKRKDSAARTNSQDSEYLWTQHRNPSSDDIGLALSTPPTPTDPPPSPPLGLREGSTSRAAWRADDTDAGSTSSSSSSVEAVISDAPPLKPCDFPLSSLSVPVVPPVLNPFELPGFQWLSESAASSRPNDMWSWSKRWTCCCCGGRTIVEQGQCAKLVCAHVRCEGKCRVVRVERVPPI